ncbi:hypothetical protein Syun_029885 [Stephania yunnanensis]|uniref:CCHC-type domain-containing protein n=1 Tax=Stephania yunnanensis TaxID=152371 RepID=A0AAP0E6G7_9MAGN
MDAETERDAMDPTKKVRFRDADTIQEKDPHDNNNLMDTDAGMDRASSAKQGGKASTLSETGMISEGVSDKECQSMDGTPSYKERLVRDTMFGAGIRIPIEEGDLVFGADDQGKFLRTSARLRGRTMEPWQFSVVVKLVGRNIGYRVLCNKIKEMWRPSGDFWVIDLLNNFFMVQLANLGDMQTALINGPWFIMGHCLSVQKWTPAFRASTALISKVTTWIRFPDLPFYHYHESIMWGLGDLVGTSVKIDYNTQLVSRGSFPRVEVELDISKPLAAAVRIDDVWQQVAYEGLPNICFGCGHTGHNSISCPLILVPTKTGAPADIPSSSTAMPQAPSNTTKATTDKFGPWMIIEHPNSARFSRTPIKASGSRFNVLKDLPGTRNSISEADDGLPTNRDNPWIFGSTPPPHLKNGSSSIPYGESTNKAGKAKKGKKDGVRVEYVTTDTQSGEEITPSQKVNKSKRFNNKLKAPLISPAKGPLQLQGPTAHSITYKPSDFPKIVGVGKGTVQVWCPVLDANYDFANRLNEGSKKRTRRSDHDLAHDPFPNDKSRPPPMQPTRAETMAMEDCSAMEADREEGQEVPRLIETSPSCGM